MTDKQTQIEAFFLSFSPILYLEEGLRTFFLYETFPVDPILAGRGQTDKSPKIKMCRIICDNTNGTRSRENIYVHMYMV